MPCKIILLLILPKANTSKVATRLVTGLLVILPPILAALIKVLVKVPIEITLTCAYESDTKLMLLFFMVASILAFAVMILLSFASETIP